MIRFFILSAFMLICSCNSNWFKNIDETSSQEQRDYYKISQKDAYDDNGVIVSIDVPKHSKSLNIGGNTLMQYEWYENGKRNLISIDKLESVNTTPFSNDDESYNTQIKDFWFNEAKENLESVKRILPHFYTNVQMISFEPTLIIDEKYYARRSLYCNDSRTLEDSLRNNKILEIHCITLENGRKYTVSYRYYGGDKGISDVISLAHTIIGTTRFDTVKTNSFHVSQITIPSDTLCYLKNDMTLLNGWVYKIFGYEGEFISGFRQGLHKYWFENGQLEDEVNYKDGYLDGFYKRWHENGQLACEADYTLGSLNGLGKVWYENGQLEHEENYIDGEKHGISKAWYENGQLEHERNYIDGNIHGHWRSWHKNGQLEHEKNYIDGEKHGIWRSWHENGRLEYEKKYVDGEHHFLKDVYNVWHDDGSISLQSHWENGVKHGTHKQWHKNGNLQSVGYYSDGERVGSFKIYNSDGAFVRYLP